MNSSTPQKTTQYLKNKKKRKAWYKLILAMSSVVVFLTVYLLILPAITLETDTLCGMEEHTHTAECFAKADAGSENPVLVCTKEEHTHTEACYPPKETETIKATEQSQPEQTVTESPVAEPSETETAKAEPTPETPSTEHPVPEAPPSPDPSDETESVTKTEAPESVTADSEPLPLVPYIDSTTNPPRLYYKDSSNNWVLISSSTSEVPANAAAKLEINYTDVPISDLLAAGCTITYTLPELLTTPPQEGQLIADGAVAGRLIADGNSVVRLQFDQAWLEKRLNESPTISGDFNIELAFDWSKIKEDENNQITIGNVTIQIPFESDLTAKYGALNLEKSEPILTEEYDENRNKKVYLTYTLRVSIPEGSSAIPDVRVADHFPTTSDAPAGNSFIREYVGISETKTTLTAADAPGTIGPSGEPRETIQSASGEAGAGKVYLGVIPDAEHTLPQQAAGSPSKPGALVWEIGDMQPGETRTLTYRVLVNPEYATNKPQGNISNQAEAFSKTYFKKEDTALYIPKVNVNSRKTDSAFDPATGKLSFTITLNAPADNSFTLDSLKIYDKIYDRSQNDLRDYVEFDLDSIRIVSNINGEIPLADIPVPSGQNNPDMRDQGNQYMDLFVGSLAPGETKTIQYDLKVKPELLAKQNTASYVNNEARIYAMKGNTNQDGFYYGMPTTTTLLGHKVWDRKITGGRQEQTRDVTIPADHPVYRYGDGDTPVLSDSPGTFQIPEGSYQYQVLVNEAGDWDLSAANFSDQLGRYLAYTGYVKVEAFQIGEDATPPNTLDVNAIASFSGKTPAKTVWLDIEDRQNFNFHPEALGLDSTYAYLLTYYAKPINMESISEVQVTNSFTLSGTGVGPYATITIPGITVSVGVNVTGGYHFNAHKYTWYYAPAGEEAGTGSNWVNGALFWAVELDTSSLNENISIRDEIPASGQHQMQLDSVEGVFIGSIPDGKNINDYANLEAFRPLMTQELLGNTLNLKYSDDTVPENADYKWEAEATWLKLDFLKDLTIPDGQKVYIILKTKPLQLPTGKRGFVTYRNGLRTSTDDGATWTTQNEASKSLAGKGGVIKETYGAFNRAQDGTWTELHRPAGADGNHAIKQNYITEPGTYVDWIIHVNYGGTISGVAEMLDQLPEGLELAYVDRCWCPPWYGNNGFSQPTAVQIPELQDADGWTELHFSSSYSYYNKNTGEVRWNVAGLKGDPSGVENHGVEFQVVCRVTDTLKPGETTYQNHITATAPNGAQYEDSADISFTKSTLSKSAGVYNPSVHGPKYPFEIQVNPLGEDLVPGSDTLTLVDSMSDKLILDSESLTVKNTKTGQLVEGWTSSLLDNTLRIVLPDGIPLTITYETLLQAAPGEPLDFSNDAYYEGQAAPDSGKVNVDDFSYTIGGTVESLYPTFRLIKADRNNTAVHLSGAEFKIQKVGTATDPDGTIILGTTEETAVYQGSTDADGILNVANLLEFNQIYCLTETKAPDGYLLDSTPVYFAVAKGNRENVVMVYPDFPENVNVWYGGSTYTYTFYNSSGEAAVTKQFLKSDGTVADRSVNGTYRFGLYAEVQTGTAADPLQILTITYQNNVPVYQLNGNGVSRPVFTGLTPGETYYIYELDTDGNPVFDGTTALIDRFSFVVTYPGGENPNRVTIGTASSSSAEMPTVEVNNQSTAILLPSAGGSGTTLYYLFGASAFLLALLGYAFYKKKSLKQITDI